MGRVERYFRRRYGGTEATVVEQPPVVVTPEAQLDVADLTPTELRLLGQSLGTKERFIGGLREKIDYVELKAFHREKEGKDAGGTRARLAGLRDQLSREQSEYDAMRERLNARTFSAAKAAAPKRYNEQRLRERDYDPSGDNPELNTIAREQRRSFVQARELAQKQPGIYQYRSGGAFVSSAQDGTYVNQRGETVRIRTPIGQRSDRSFIYGVEEQPRMITGIDLFDQQNVAAIRSSGNRYATAGALFASASEGPSFTPVPAAQGYDPKTTTFGGFFRQTLSRTFQGKQQGGFLGGFLSAYSSEQEYFLESRNPVVRSASGITRGTRLAGSGVELVGSRIYGNQQNTPLMRWLGGVVEGAGGYAKTQPVLFNAELAATYIGGRYAGGLFAGLQTRLASRTVARRAVTGGLFALGTTALVYDVGTSTPQEFGRGVPGYISFGKGFTSGYRAVNPRVEFLGFADRRGVGAFESRGTKYSMTGTGTNTFLADVAVNGKAQRVPFRLDTLYTGQRYPGGRRVYKGKYARGEQGNVLSAPAQNFFNVEALQYGTFTVAGRDYYVPGRSFTGAFSKSRGLFIAKSGDTLFASESFRKKTPRGKRIGRFAVLEGAVPTVTTTGIDVRSSTILPYTKNRFGAATFDTDFGSFDVNAFIGQRRQFSYGGVASRSRASGGADQSFLNRAFGFGERTGVLPRTRIEPRPYRERMTLFPKRYSRLYSAPFPILEPASPTTAQRYKTRNPFYPTGGRGVHVTDPFVNALPFLPETTRFGSRGPLAFGRSPSFNLGSVTGVGPAARIRPYTRPERGMLPNVIVGRITQVTPAFDTRSVLRGITGTTPVPRPFTPGINIPGSPGSPPPFVPGFPFPGVGGPVFGGFAGGRTSRRSYRYAPDLYSMFFGVRAKGRKARSLRNRSFTGLEIRPVV